MDNNNDRSSFNVDTNGLNSDFPDKLLNDLRNWIEEIDRCRKFCTSAEIKARYHTLTDMVKGFERLNFPIPEVLINEKVKIEEAFNSQKVYRDVLSTMEKELSGLVADIKMRLRGRVDNPTTDSPKEPRKKLLVTFPDGIEINENNATNTFLEVIRQIGVKRVAELTSIRAYGHSIVSDTRNEHGYALHDVDGYFVETSSDTETKANVLREIASNLKMEMKVEVYR